MKSLIKIVLLAAVVIIGYNYFFGDEKEQEQAEKIVGKVKDLGADIKALVVSEREKFDEGKYDKAVDKFTDLINSVKDKVSAIDLRKLEEKQERLKEAVEKIKEKASENSEVEGEKVGAEMEELLEDIRKSVEEIEF